MPSSATMSKPNGRAAASVSPNGRGALRSSCLSATMSKPNGRAAASVSPNGRGALRSSCLSRSGVGLCDNGSLLLELAWGDVGH